MTECTSDGIHFINEDDIISALQRGKFHLEPSEGIYIDNLECRYCGQRFAGEQMISFRVDGVDDGYNRNVEIGERHE